MHKIIRKKTGLASLDLQELWQFRELLGFLAWRDLLVRYKQTAIGVTWAFIRPLLTMVVFTFIFGRVAKLPSQGIPYPLLTFAGLLPWHFFSSAFNEAASSIVGHVQMISKVYFPRLVIPISSIISALVDFLISFGIFLVMMLWYGMPLTARALTVPFFFLLALLFALGLGLWFSAFYVRYRDVRHLIPFMLQLGIYISPVGFSSAIVPERWRFLYSLNPMVGVIDGFRWALLGGPSQIYPAGLVLSVVVVFVVLVSGLYYFKKIERIFADII